MSFPTLDGFAGKTAVFDRRCTMRFRGVVAVPVVVVGVWLGVAGGGLAGESGFAVKVGDTEEAVLNALGKPKGSMAMSGRKTLSYAECYVVVENGVVLVTRRDDPGAVRAAVDAVKARGWTDLL